MFLQITHTVRDQQFLLNFTMKLCRKKYRATFILALFLRACV